MKSWKVYAQIAAWSFLVLLLIPPLWYSLRTPFALVDDYGIWYIFQSLTSVSGIIQWWHDTWSHGRFRIIFDLYQLVTWGILGDNSALHHGLRWVLKGIVVWSTFKILRLMTPAGRSSVGLPFWVFCAVYIFFPNNPEARLGPQEILTVTFLALLLYELARLCVRARGDLAELGLGRYLWMLFVFTAMLWAKEPNIVMGMVTLMVLICLNFKRWIRLFPFIAILLITGLRVHAETTVSSYGTAPITWGLIYQNIIFHGKSLLLGKVAMTGTLLLGAGYLVAQTWKARLKEKDGLRGMIPWLLSHPVLTFSWLLCLNTLAFFTTLLITWHLVLRYFYPLVYLLALWIALALLSIDTLSSRRRLAVTWFAIIASVYFIGANYYNFVYQFADQYYTRTVEHDVLRNVDKLLREGRTVTLTLDAEYEYNIKYYFNSFLPYYKHTNYRVTIGPPAAADCEGCYYVTRNKDLLQAGHQWYRRFDSGHVSRILWWCDRLSSWFYFGHPAFYWRDLGADWIGRHGEETTIWYIDSCRDIGYCSQWAKNS